MKRFIVLTMMLSFGLFLSGCDLISQDVIDQVSEELCAEDPDNELCNPEALQNLEDAVVMELAEEAYLRVKEKANKTSCRTYFSPTNVDLLNQCLDENNSLIPEGFETFTSVSVEADGDFYKVTGTSTDDVEITVIVRLTEVEGTTYVDHFEVIVPSTQYDVITTEDAKEALQTFIDNYLDASVANDVICPIFDGEDNDCNMFRPEDLENGIQIAIDYLDPDDDGDGIFTAYLIITDADGEANQVEVEVEVFRQDFGPVISRMKVSEVQQEEVEYDEAIEFFEEFVSNYLDPTVSNEYLYEKFFLNMIDEDEFDGRLEELEKGFGIEIVSSSEAEDGWVSVTLRIFEGEMSETEEIKIKVNRIDMALYLEIEDGVDDDCDGPTDDECFVRDYTQAYEFYMKYFDDYSNPEITTEEFAAMYFDGHLDEDFKAMREDDLSKGVKTELVELYWRDDSFFDIEYRYQDGDDLILRKRPGRIRQRPDLLTAEWDELIDEHLEFVTNPDEVLDFFTMFVEYYTDASISTDLINETFFMNKLESGFYEERQFNLENGFMVEILDFMQDVDYPEVFWFTLEFTEGNEVYTETIEVRVNRIEMALFLDLDGEDNDCDGVDDDCDGPIEDEDTVYNFFMMFVDYYTNSMYTTDEINEKFFGGWMEADFFEQRTFELEQGIVVDVLSFERDMYEPTLFHAEISLTIGEETMVQTLEVRVNRIDMALVLDFDDNDECDDCINYIENAYEVWLQFIDAYNNPDVSTDEINEMFFMGMVGIDFYETRQLNLDNNAMYFLEEIRFRGESMAMLEAKVRYVENGMDHTDSIPFWLLEENGVFYIVIYEEMEQYEEIADRVGRFVEDYILLEGDYHELCFEHFTFSTHALCDAFVKYHLDNGYFFYYTDIYMDNNEVHVVFDTFDVFGEYIETNIFTVRIETQDDGTSPLYVESKHEGNNPLFQAGE